MIDMIDRFMKAFVRQHPLTAKQELKVRAEITEFAQGLRTSYEIALTKRRELIDKRE